MADPRTSIKMATTIWLQSYAHEFVTGRVLDLGCGRKPYKRLFPDCEWVGLDNRPVGDVEADAHQLPFAECEFDTVLCTELLHLSPAPLLIVNEAARVLKPGGCLVVSAPCTTPTDEATFLGVHPRALDFWIGNAGLKGIDIRAEGRLVSQEWNDLDTHQQHTFPYAEARGWLDLMDNRYPAITCAVARKE